MVSRNRIDDVVSRRHEADGGKMFALVVKCGTKEQARLAADNLDYLGLARPHAMHVLPLDQVELCQEPPTPLRDRFVWVDLVIWGSLLLGLACVAINLWLF